MKQSDVVIVGGGPVGLGLAIDLALRSVNVQVLERTTALHQIPKGQNLTQRTAEMLRKWGVAKQVREASPIPREFGNAGLVTYGHLLSDYHYDWFQRSKVGAYYFAENERLPQYLLEGILRQRIEDLPHVAIDTGSEVTRIEQGLVGVDVDYVKNGVENRLQANYLVGCDGARSVVREQAGIELEEYHQGPKMALLVFRSTELDTLLSRYPGKSIFNVMNPALGGYWQFLGRYDLNGGWFYHVPLPAGTTLGAIDFNQHLHDMVGASFALEFEHIGSWDLRIAHAQTYRTGNVFIAGDAAHSHPPYGGYGINTGLEDASNLSWKLAASLNGWGDDALLDSYTTERHPVFKSISQDFIQRMIDDFREFLHEFSPQKNSQVFNQAWQQRASANDSAVVEFLPNYAGSCLVFGEDSATSSAKGEHQFIARPGHHIAPQSLADGSSLWEKLNNGGFTLLEFTDNQKLINRFDQAAKQCNIPLVSYTIPDKALQEAYAADAILVRPDLYIAWTSNVDIADPLSVMKRVTSGLMVDAPYGLIHPAKPEQQ